MPKTTKRATSRGSNSKSKAAKARTSTTKKTTRTTKRSAAKATVTLREKNKIEGQLAGRPMHSVTGQLILDGAREAIAWYGKAFGAKQLDLKPTPDGRVMHAVLEIGDTMLMVSDPFGPPGSAPKTLNGAFLHIQDRNIDSMWQKAIANGATAEMPLANQFWGDRYGQLRDPWGQLWSFGWPAKMTEAEKQKLMREAMAMTPS